jgi:uncharacterized surface protein with fasciclin (FAS1) repeats
MWKWFKVPMLLSASIWLTACGGSDDPAPHPNLATVAQQQGFNALLSAATKAGLSSSLADPTTSVTVLAPSDAAFAKLATQLGFTDATAMVNGLDAATLGKVLSYHVIAGKKPASELVKSATVSTAYAYPSAGTASTLKITAGATVKFTDAALTDATVTTADVNASNGIIHAVDKVLVPPGVLTVLQMAQVNPSFSVLGSAVKSANLSATLNGAGPFTVFAPTDTAFTAALTELGLTSAQLLANTPLLTQVLTYHVVSGKVARAQVPLGKAVTTVEGSILKVDAAGMDLQITDGRNRLSKIVATDVMASNGIIHVVDKVLLPANRNIVETAVALPQFSILVEAVVAADLQGALSGAGPLTVFAPTNTAFAAALTELGLTKEQLFANKALLTKVLTYHVVGTRALKADITPGSPIASLQGDSLTINSSLAITDQRGRSAQITTTDVLTRNGVIHVIDKVILPKP